MGITVYREQGVQGILRWQLDREWTIDDFQQAAATNLRLITEGKRRRRYYTIIAAPDDSRAPAGMMTQTRRLLTEYSDPREVFIRVGGSLGQRTMDMAFLHAFRVFGERFYYVDTIRDAMVLVRELESRASTE
ncbi:MAG: hypothetical protein AAF787_10500 [Chloroflexota bacterium]